MFSVIEILIISGVVPDDALVEKGPIHAFDAAP
jgi:hypothetical protein